MATFVKTVESGSFAAAGSALGMSAQMAAKHVAYLEARLGARLLNRTTRRQSLTAVGRTYYDRCKVVLAEAAWAEALADEARGAPRGSLRINAPVTFGTHRLTPLVSRYLTAHPGVEVELFLNDRLIDPFEDGFEATFRIGHLPDTKLQAIELAPFRTIVCASPAYLRDRGTPSTPAELADHECIAFANWPEAMTREWQFMWNDRVFHAPTAGRLKVNSAIAMLHAALAGFGLASIAVDLARPHLEAGQLVRVLPDFESPSRPIHLILLPDRRQTPKLRSFIELVEAELG